MEFSIGQKRLERIILINSSTFRYAEIFVDGNTHIAGDNSVGKSTFLQIATLFYTGDPTRSKLGIGDGKLPFQQYNLQHNYSDIIYEVRRSDAPSDCFMVVLRSSSWPTFTFFDCPYSKDIFVDENDAAYDNLEQIKNAARRIHSKDLDIRSVKGAREYIDILYGWRNGRSGRDRSWEKFSLTSCPGGDRPHEKIANLLQMLLNLGKVQGDVLKKMIVSSLESTSQPFNVNTHRENAQELFKTYTAIRNWNTDPTMRQSQERFVKAYRAYNDEKKAHALYPGQAKFAMNEADEAKEATVKELEAEKKILADLTAKIQERRENTASELKSLEGTMSVITANIQKVGQKRSEFASFASLLPLFESEDEKIRDKDFNDKLLAQLSSKSQTLSDSFQKQKDELIAALKLKESEGRGEKARLTSASAQALNEYSEKLEEERLARKALYDKTSTALQANLDAAFKSLSGKEQERFTISLSHPKKKEIDEAVAALEQIKKDIAVLDRSKDPIKIDIASAEAAKTAIPDNVRVEHSETLRKLASAVETLREKQETQKSKIASYEGSLAEWLDGNLSHWTGTVGKVMDEKVLLRSDLSPSLVSESTTAVYGVSVDLDKLDYAKTTPALLKEELADIEEKLSKASDELDAENQTVESTISERLATQDAIIKEKNAEIAAIGEQIAAKEADKSHQESIIAALAAEEEVIVNDALKKKDDEIEEAKKAHAKVKSTLEKEQTSYSDFENNLTQRRKNKSEELNQKLEKDKADVDTKIKEAKEQTSCLIADLDKALAEALSEQGVDPEKIAKIQATISSLEGDLKTISDNKRKYYSYLEAKKEYFDKESEWKDDLARIKERIQKITDNNKALIEDEDRRVDVQQKEVDRFQGYIDSYDESIMLVREYFQEHRKEEFDSCEPVETSDTANVIIEHDQKSDERLKGAQDTMDNCWLKFGRILGEFGLRQFFPYSASCTDIKEDTAAQDDVYEFIIEDKISAHTLAWNTHAVPFVSEINYAASDFNKDIENIKGIARDINRTFKANNFTEVIKRFELSVEEVGTELISLIHGSRTIHRDFCEEYDGTRNLLDGSTKNKRFIDYIQQLATKLVTYNFETIQIEDMFTLYIEADEGTNKSGRKKEIRELGSNGIDTIFKNILYLLMIQNIRKRFGRQADTFMIHCPLDEQATISPTNFNHLMSLANKLGIFILANSPLMPIGTEESFKRAYKFFKNPGTDFTNSKLLLTTHEES